MKVDTGMVAQQKQGHVFAVPQDRLWVQQQTRLAQAALHGAWACFPESEAHGAQAFIPIEEVMSSLP